MNVYKTEKERKRIARPKGEMLPADRSGRKQYNAKHDTE
jgi:hypothetical protein